MKKLVIVSCLIAALIAGLVGGTVAAGRTQPGLVSGPVMMDGGSGNLTISYLPDDWPQFVSPQYPQMRHISVTLFAVGMTEGSPAPDDINVRAYFNNGQGGLLTVPILRFTGCDQNGMVRGTIEFDATKWDIIGSDNDQSGDFRVYFSYTTTYPNTQNQQ